MLSDGVAQGSPVTKKVLFVYFIVLIVDARRNGMEWNERDE